MSEEEKTDTNTQLEEAQLVSECHEIEELKERADIDLQRVSEEIEVEKTEEIVINPRFGPRKSDLIKSIQKLTDEFSARNLSRRRKAELETILADLFEAKCDVVIDEVPRPDRKMMVDTLVKITHALCGLVEFGTKRYHRYLGGYCLHDFTKNVQSPSSDALLRDVMTDVYKENEEFLISVLSKESKLCKASYWRGPRV